MERKWIILSVFILMGFGLLLSVNSQILKVPSAAENAPPPNDSSNPVLPSPAGPTPKFPLVLPSGFTIHIFASGLGRARDLEFTPAGTLLVSNPENNTVTALPDPNQEGIASVKKVVINQGNRIHGLAFYNGQLFIAETTRVVRFHWDETTLTATLDKVLFSLPSNNDHNLRTITFDHNGKMYVSVGSTCNICEEANQFSATVIESDSEGNNPHIFASGLRNASFIKFNPGSQELWGTDMGRDYLGDNLPPDEINIIRKDADYGWPWCYGNKVHDFDFDPSNSHSCDNTATPLYEIPAHSAPLGLEFINSPQFPGDWQGDLLVAYHGSWNRRQPIGYKVVHLKVSGNSITESSDFLTGFLPLNATTGPSDALGRPVDLIFDKQGNLYLSDDKAGNVYIIQRLAR